MARRRYKNDALSAAGHGEKPAEAAPPEQHPLGSEPTPPQPPAPDQKAEAEPAQHFSTGLGEQIRQQQQYAQNDALDHYVAAHFPGALPNERAWLRMNPHHLQNPMLTHHAASIALQRGIPRQSEEFLRFVGQLLDQHHAAAQAAAAPKPTSTHIDISKTENVEYEPEESHMSAAHHVSAPVSRDVQFAGEPEPSANRITLNPQEREIAKQSGISEELYAAGKLKLAKMKKAKLISD